MAEQLSGIAREDLERSLQDKASLTQIFQYRNLSFKKRALQCWNKSEKALRLYKKLRFITSESDATKLELILILIQIECEIQRCTDGSQNASLNLKKSLSYPHLENFMPSLGEEGSIARASCTYNSTSNKRIC